MSERVTLQPETEAVFRRMGELGLRNKELAAALNLDPAKVSKMRSGERQIQAGEILRANAWLDDIESRAARSLPDIPPTRTAEEDTVEVPQVDLSFSMGPGISIDDYIEETPVRFDLAFIRNITRTPPHRLRLARGIGDSMFPTLLTNDRVMIDTTQTMLNLQDRVWACSLFGAAAIKRLRNIGGGKVLVISDNPGVDNQEIDAEEIRLAGRVIWFSRDL